VGFTFTRNAVFVNRRALEALSAADQAALRTAAATAETRGWRMAEEAHTAAMDTLRSRGVTVTMGNATVMEGMNRISEQMVNEWLTRAGEDGQRVIQAVRTARG
jgi:TRAP-type C4-dicarboxylate transport system substrate-binding protein